jgi:hypothetical protein
MQELNNVRPFNDIERISTYLLLNLDSLLPIDKLCREHADTNCKQNIIFCKQMIPFEYISIRGIKEDGQNIRI